MGTSEALKLKLHSKINQFEIRLLNPWTDQVMITMFLFRIEFFAKSYSITNWFVQGCSWYFQMKLELFLSVRQIVSQGGREWEEMFACHWVTWTWFEGCQNRNETFRFIMHTDLSFLTGPASHLWVCSFLLLCLQVALKRDPQQLFVARILRNEIIIQQIQIF